MSDACAGENPLTGEWKVRNDIAVVWPTSGSPLVIAIQSDRDAPGAPSADALIAEATKVVITTLKGTR